VEDNAAALRMANVWKAKLMQKKEKEESEPLKTPININEAENKVRRRHAMMTIMLTFRSLKETRKSLSGYVSRKPSSFPCLEPFWYDCCPVCSALSPYIQVAFFSDPMVDVITRVGLQLNIGAFYVSFVITPLCSNASELIASLVFAMSKTKQSASMTYALQIALIDSLFSL
jgi:Ca2+/H+ antiporter